MTLLSLPSRVFYGWWVVSSLATIMFLSAGLGFYALGVFVTPFEEEFGWSRGQVSVGIALASIVSGLLGPLVGLAVDRWGARSVLAVGATGMRLNHTVTVLVVVFCGFAGLIGWLTSETIKEAAFKRFDAIWASGLARTELQFITKKPKASRALDSATCKVLSSSSSSCSYSSSKSKVQKRCRGRRRVRAQIRIKLRTKSAFHNLHLILRSFFFYQTDRFFGQRPR